MEAIQSVMDTAQMSIRLRSAYVLYHNRRCHYFGHPPASLAFIVKPTAKVYQMSIKLAERLAKVNIDDAEGYVRAAFDAFTDPFFSMLLSDKVMKHYQKNESRWMEDLTDELREQYVIIKDAWYSIPPELPVEVRVGCLLESVIRPRFQETGPVNQFWTTPMNGIYLLAFFRAAGRPEIWKKYRDFLTLRAMYDFLLWPKGYLRHPQWKTIVMASGIGKVIEADYAHKE